MKIHIRAFSLIEVVISIGIFAFCIVGIVGLLPIASNSVKSVSLESNANNIAESISGIWQVVSANSTTPVSVSIPLGGNRTMGNFTIPAVSDNQTYYYDNDCRYTGSTLSPDASIRLNYTAAQLGTVGNTFTVNLTFTWPPTASSNITTTRTYNYIFAK